MKTCKILLAALAIFAGPPLFAPDAAFAGADEFRTQEYLAGKGLEAIHAAEAYALGFTGKGVTVGVLDSNVFPGHQEFSQKFISYAFFTLPREGDYHGVHTAGTIAASKNSLGMHGVAFDANLVSIVGVDGSNRWQRSALHSEAMRAFREYPSVSIISNSWSYGNALAEYPWALSQFAEDMETMTNTMAPMAVDMDILFVFAASNDGKSSPSTLAAVPSFLLGASVAGKTIAPYNFPEITAGQKRALSLNMLSVSAFAPERDTNRLDFIAPFSNLTDGAASYSLFAPGVGVYSAYGGNIDSYRFESGSSMAAPHVAGVAALVKEAFPYMGGKQLADVLLSTATPLSAMQGLPPFVIQTMRDLNGEYKWFSIITPQPVSSADLAGRDEEIRNLWESSGRAEHETFEDFKARLATAMDGSSNADPAVLFDGGFQLIPKHIISPGQYAQLFGMGVVNAYKAARGPGWFDANRLNNGDRSEFGGRDYAMYPIDAKGHDSVWSNDIFQIRVQNAGTYGNGVNLPAPNDFNRDLLDLDVGLLKRGGGILHLTGSNNYAGPTVVHEGGIALGVSGQADGAARLTGDVYVEPDGIFSGNGRIGGNLHSRGLLAPGLADAPGSALTVDGHVTSRGNLLFSLGPGNAANRLHVGGNADLTSSTLDIAGLDGHESLPHGRYELVKAGALTSDLNGARTQARQGVTLIHNFSALATADRLYAIHESTEAAPQAKVLSEGFIAGTILVAQGADAVAGPALAEAGKSVRAATCARQNAEGWSISPFAAVSAGNVRHNTGSHVDMTSFSFVTGIAGGLEISPGFLTLGAFFEYGAGSYSTYNSFSKASAISGNGSASYLGGGLLGRMDFSGYGPGHVYIETSGRAGRVRNGYDPEDLTDHKGQNAEYEADAPYYGFHAGLGYIWNLTEKMTVDIYGKYLLTHQRGKSARLATGEIVDFEPVTSSRLRLGGRYSYAVQKGLLPYIGAAWEHEFDGAAQASTRGYAFGAPSMKGGTGIGEIGLSAALTEKAPLYFDIGLQGYTGKREGVTGSLQIRFEF